jgi:hypothetical protein
MLEGFLKAEARMELVKNNTLTGYDDESPLKVCRIR